MSNERILRKYIRESLLREFGLKDVGKALGISGGPDEWFSSFLSRQFGKMGKSIDKALGSKLEELLPDDFKQKVAAHAKEKNKSDVDASEPLAKMISTWMEEYEEITGKSLESKVDEVLDVAAQEYAEAIQKDPKNLKKALLLAKKKLDAKYGDPKSPKIK
jgi:hypothetical protein